MDEVYIPLLLQLLPNLSTLSLDLPPNADFLSRALDQATTVIPCYTARLPFSRLQAVHIRCSNYVRLHDIEILQRFLHSPHLRDISVCSLGTKLGSLRTWAVEPRSCNATSLYLNYCVLEPHTLSLILHSFHALKEFSYTHAEWHGMLFDPLSFGRALEGVKSSLESLEIDSRAGPFALRSQLGSLRQFTKLKSFTGDFSLLVDPYPASPSSSRLRDILPASIKSLFLTDFGQSNWAQQLEQITELVENKSVINTPCLMRLSTRYGISNWPSPECLGQYDRLRELGKAADVTINCPFREEGASIP